MGQCCAKEIFFEELEPEILEGKIIIKLNSDGKHAPPYEYNVNLLDKFEPFLRKIAAEHEVNHEEIKLIYKQMISKKGKWLRSMICTVGDEHEEATLKDNKIKLN